MTQSHEIAPGFRPDIQGLRAIAILMVLGYHAHLPGFGGGFAGVDVFFALSGYLITSMLLRELENTSRIDFPRFYARRIRRLLPAALCMTIFTLLGGLAILSPIEITGLAQSATATSAYVSNLWFLKQSTDYFNSTVASNPLLHTWSLSVEEQFYLMWPVVVVLAVRMCKTRRGLIVVFGVIALVSFCAGFWLTRSFQSIAFFSPLTRAWEFVIGGLAGIVKGNRFLKGLYRPAFAWCGVVLLLVSAAFLRPGNQFPCPMALVPVAGTSVLLMGGGQNSQGQWLTKILNSRLFQWVGDMSYSLYLWHWPVLVFGTILLRRRSGIAVSLGLLAVSVVIAALCHRFVEAPLRLSTRYRSSPWVWVRLGLGVTVAGVAAGVAFIALGHHLERIPPNASYVYASAPGSMDDRQCLTGFGSDRIHPCSFGPDGGRTVVLWGDSHAAQWLPALKFVAAANGWRVVTLLKASCPSTDVTVYNPRLRRNEGECSSWRHAAVSYVRSLRPMMVLMSNSSAYVARASFTDEYARLSPEEWEEGTRSTIRAVTDSAGTVVLLRDTPRPDIDVPVCLSRAASHPGIFSSDECDISSGRALAPTIWQREMVAADGFVNIAFLDMTSYFCSHELCPAIENGVVVYRDGNHMALDFSASLGNSLGKALQAIAGHPRVEAGVQADRPTPRS